MPGPAGSWSPAPGAGADVTGAGTGRGGGDCGLLVIAVDLLPFGDPGQEIVLVAVERVEGVADLDALIPRQVFRGDAGMRAGQVPAGEALGDLVLGGAVGGLEPDPAEDDVDLGEQVI